MPLSHKQTLHGLDNYEAENIIFQSAAPLNNLRLRHVNNAMAKLAISDNSPEILCDGYQLPIGLNLIKSEGLILLVEPGEERVIRAYEIIKVDSKLLKIRLEFWSSHHRKGELSGFNYYLITELLKNYSIEITNEQLIEYGRFWEEMITQILTDKTAKLFKRGEEITSIDQFQKTFFDVCDQRQFLISL